MRDLPDIADLMELTSGADPGLAARCQAIAERERLQGWAPYAALAPEMAKLLDLPVGLDLLARLAAEIRRGELGDNAEVESLLWLYVCQRLKENEPELLIYNSMI
jgi:hypothetical protein